jgi:hypothetical protein
LFGEDRTSRRERLRRVVAERQREAGADVVPDESATAENEVLGEEVSTEEQRSGEMDTDTKVDTKKEVRWSMLS